ncbi:MAG: hypothetical protein R3E42_09160 [Burkholderiaceae bacterium]
MTVLDVALTIRQARATMRIVKQNLLWAALYNAVSIPLALMGLMPPWLAGLGMAGSSLLVIVNALRWFKWTSAQAWAAADHHRDGVALSQVF